MMIEEGSFQQNKWLAHERFRVALSFNPNNASDVDLQRLCNDAVKLLGQPIGHEYAVGVIAAVIGELEMRAIERRLKMEH